ncbi:bifunctional phosphopantothenoylcysteine decarboxylase/phosphopantothenate--cysteine ligase CoaBC [Sulfurimonas sp. HSL-1656]|uniref:bifunctional phosphopantothenoylcysteine decarboxylase/phosphopantothenate--cysteine ligase CoaBC n=1 Tax=Thiomicrolovo subterrani TaxID=3131934 RepID=UPI0031F9DECE
MTIPSDLLAGKRILLGVSGSIAAYKALELVRLYVKAGAEVKVVMTDAAKKFVTPLSFETLSRNEVLHSGNESWVSRHNHIQSTEDADLMVIAPASANTIAKLANAIADNLLLQCALAFPGVKLLAPSANTNMIKHPITQANLKMLGVANYEIVRTQTKELACQTTGDGAMAEPLELFWQSARLLLKNDFWSHRRVIVTGGGTVERLDDVRYLSNFSSGKMASALATALYLRGADVNLIATRFDDGLPESMHTLDVEGSEEMAEYLTDSIRVAKKGMMSKPSLITDEPIHLIQKTPYLFMAAAVSDYVPAHPQQGKLKKEALGIAWSPELVQNRDLIGSVDKEGIKSVAFKAEFDESSALENAKKALSSKNVDAVCLNVLTASQGFGSDDNAITFISGQGEKVLPRCGKLALSLQLLDEAEGL